MRTVEPIPLLTPSAPTLAKYGLNEAEWRAMADAQGEACKVCKQKPTKGRLCIDHEHVKQWKKLLPEHRKLFVRGLLCFRCNTTFVGRGITVERSRNVTAYLEDYQSRRPAEVPTPPKKIRGRKRK
jgi:hypothetical protein